MPRVVQRPAARRDFIIHYAYISEHAGLDVAKRFRESVEATYAALAKMPRVGVPFKVRYAGRLCCFYRRLGIGKEPRIAAEIGGREVALLVLAATLTSAVKIVNSSRGSMRAAARPEGEAPVADHDCRGHDVPALAVKFLRISLKRLPRPLDRLATEV
jgi:plasmid stabilization system protein ParE